MQSWSGVSSWEGHKRLTQYKIEIGQPAVQDLQDILDYIANVLKEPAAAQRIYTSIKVEILTLASMPERNRVVDDEPYATMGVRRLFVENYVVFYMIDRSRYTVHVLRVLYNRREWQSILGNK